MHQLSHFLEEHFAGMATCPLCRKKYDPLEARIIMGDDGAELVHVECQRCRGAIIAKISGSHRGATSMIGIVTDLSSRDLLRLQSKTAIDADDVVSLYTLVTHDGGSAFLQTLNDTP